MDSVLGQFANTAGHFSKCNAQWGGAVILQISLSNLRFLLVLYPENLKISALIFQAGRNGNNHPEIIDTPAASHNQFRFFIIGYCLTMCRCCRRAMGLHQAVALCMEHCQAAELAADASWFKTVVLAGGSACLPGLAERLERELNGMLPLFMTSGIRVLPPPYGVNSAWFGAKLVGNLSTFPGPWCMTKKQFRQKSRFRQSINPW